MGYMVRLFSIRVAFMTAVGFMLWVFGRMLVDITEDERYIVPQIVGAILLTIGIAKFLWKAMP